MFYAGGVIAMTLQKIIKDPLFHFLAAGAVLFFALSLAAPAENEDQIIVDRNALLSFIQYRSKAFEPETAAALLDGLTAEERTRLIDDYVREEALYREAAKLGLDGDDYVIRQRLVQKLEFMTEAGAAPAAITDDAARAYYDENKTQYALPPQATFAHVFIAAKDKTPAALKAEADAMLARLRAENAGLEDAPAYGDRFLFHTNYVERTYDYIKSHFGKDATDDIFSADKPKEEWRGPVYSTYGAHLIIVRQVEPSRIPAFEEIKTRIVEDMGAEQQRARREKIIDAMIAAYDIKLDLDQE